MTKKCKTEIVSNLLIKLMVGFTMEIRQMDLTSADVNRLKMTKDWLIYRPIITQRINISS